MVIDQPGAAHAHRPLGRRRSRPALRRTSCCRGPRTVKIAQVYATASWSPGARPLPARDAHIDWPDCAQHHQHRPHADRRRFPHRRPAGPQHVKAAILKPRHFEDNFYHHRAAGGRRRWCSATPTRKITKMAMVSTATPARPRSRACSGRRSPAHARYRARLLGRARQAQRLDHGQQRRRDGARGQHAGCDDGGWVLSSTARSRRRCGSRSAA